MTTDKPFWFRLYATQADLDADEDRLIDDPPLTPIILDILFVSPDVLDLPMVTGDMEGILVFNRDDPAVDYVYYRADAMSPDEMADFFWFFSHAEPPTNLSGAVGAPTPGEPADPNNSGIWQYVDPDYIGNGRYKLSTMGCYTVNNAFDGHYAKAPASEGSFNHPGLPGAEPKGLSITSTVERSYLDAASFAAHHVYYIHNSHAPQLGEHLVLFVGVVRDSSTTVTGNIKWMDASGAMHLLEQGSITGDIALTETGTLVTEVIYDPAGPIAQVIWNGVLLASAPVPEELLIEGHDCIGLSFDATTVPEATLAWGSLSFQNYLVIPTVYTLDVGYVPLEQDGGSMELVP